MMFEKTTPVMKSTLSRLMFFSNSCLATSGLNWSSLTMTSAGRPPSLPPFSLTASRKPSRMSMPSADDGPESVLTRPILTLSAAAAGAATSERAEAAASAAAACNDDGRRGMGEVLSSSDARTAANGCGIVGTRGSAPHRRRPAALAALVSPRDVAGNDRLRAARAAAAYCWPHHGARHGPICTAARRGCGRRADPVDGAGVGLLQGLALVLPVVASRRPRDRRGARRHRRSDPRQRQLVDLGDQDRLRRRRRARQRCRVVLPVPLLRAHVHRAQALERAPTGTATRCRRASTPALTSRSRPAAPRSG